MLRKFCLASILTLLVTASACSSGKEGPGGSGTPCTPGGASTCPSGEICSADGVCVPGTAGDAGGDGATMSDTGTPPPRDGGRDGSTGGDADACASVDAVFERIIPTVHVIIDQSSSMNQLLADNVSRWNALKTALIAPETGLIPRMQSDVRFGVAFYTWNRNTGVQTCPVFTSVDPALDNESAIRTLYDATQPSHATPTGAAIRALTDQVGTVPENEPVIFILATDGLPDRCIAQNISNDPLAKQEVVDEVARAYEAGIRTFYIDVGGSIADGAHKQAVANAGVGKAADDPMPAMYYDVTASNALATALENIVRGEVSCELELAGEITDTSRACEGTVLLNGTELPCNGANGWQVIDENTVRLNGTACEMIREGGATVSASFPCGVVVI